MAGRAVNIAGHQLHSASVFHMMPSITFRRFGKPRCFVCPGEINRIFASLFDLHRMGSYAGKIRKAVLEGNTRYWMRFEILIDDFDPF